MSGILAKKQKPTSAGRRGLVKVVNTKLHKGKPYKKLLAPLSKSGGRNSNGRITTFHRGGGHKRHYRIIDWKRLDDGLRAQVIRLEYDPNRTADVALIRYPNGKHSYIVAPKGLESGMFVQSGVDAPIAVGNCLPMTHIPVGTLVHNIEMQALGGAKMARSAGAYAQIVAREGDYVTLRLRSTEVRKVRAECRAVVGEVGKSEHGLRKEGKAGRTRWKGIRPTVRGVAMNPVDHPLGGGEGRSSGGRAPCSPWGVPKGKKTRRNKTSTKLIVRRRKNKSEK